MTGNIWCRSQRHGIRCPKQGEHTRLKGTETILLVEDESTVALDIKNILESSGYEVPFIASRGEEAVKEAVKLRPDLVLMDITLKGSMDGIEAASKLIILNIPVVYLTANSDNLTLKRATKVPTYGYIVKPYNQKELITTVEMAINRHNLDQEKVENYKQDLINKKNNTYAWVHVESGEPRYPWDVQT